MRVKKRFCFCGWMFLGLAAFGSAPAEIEWSEGFSLPAQADGRAAIGVGAPFYGEHNGAVLLAGGSNFPDVPLIQGGKKRYWTDIYALLPGSTNWLRAGHLSSPLAEGMCATTPRGIVCAGGSADGQITDRCFLLTWDAARGAAAEAELPDFPCGVRLGSAAAQGNRVYVAGGEFSEAPVSDVWMLDLDLPQPEWRPLPPLPGPKGRSLPAAFVQNGDQKRTFLYVIGGYARHAAEGRDGSPNRPRTPRGGVPTSSGDGLAELCALTDGYAYDLSQPEGSGVWRPISPAVVKAEIGDQRSAVRDPTSDIRPPTSGAWPLLGARCVPVGDQHVLVFGGPDAATYNENQRRLATLTGEAREAQRIASLSITPERNRWNRHALVYHTVTDRWFSLGEVPFAPTVVGAALRRSDGSLLIATGEVRPGVRTPVCATGNFIQRRKFHRLNWSVIVAYFGGLAVMGAWFMRKKKSADDYFKGGGRIPWWAAGISIFAAMFSSISFLAIPALAYMSDWRYYIRCLPLLLLPPLVIGCYLPFFRKLKLTSAYEYLELRFNLACRLFASLAFNLFMVARVAVVAYQPSLAVAAATGADVNMCIVAVSLLTILYCAFGGIEAVIWSDVVQCAVLFGGALLVFYLLVNGTDGGLAGAFQIASSAGKLKMLDFSFDLSRPVFLVALVSGFVESFIYYTSDQCVIQRYMTTKDTRAAGRGIWLTVPLSMVSGFIFFGIGTALYTYYRSNPEQLAVTMPKADSILPVFITSGLPAGLSGLVLAGLFAATITTLAANLSASATALTNDFFVRMRKGMTDRHQVNTAKTLTVLVGLAGMTGALVLANTDIRSAFDQFVKLIGIMTGGLAGLFMLGIFARRVGAGAALCGLAANYAVCIGLEVMPVPWKPHLLLYGAIGLATCLGVALAVSLAFPNRKTVIGGLVYKRKA
ncbi:MAG: sodium/solute symporter [Kiritimatiellae bacterium]|nr:sodium/solute symporter [Kiritimatiellia bacterium]